MLRVSLVDMRRIAVRLEEERQVKQMVAQVEGMIATIKAANK